MWSEAAQIIKPQENQRRLSFNIATHLDLWPDKQGFHFQVLVKCCHCKADIDFSILNWQFGSDVDWAVQNELTEQWPMNDSFSDLFVISYNEMI